MTVKIVIVYYSMYGHIQTLADSVAKGLKETGVEVKIYQVPETLSEEVLGKMGAPPKNKDHPVITPDDLKDVDGIVWGIPTRYGRAVSQISNFFDSTGGLWMTQALNGKFTTVFSSTGTQNGGQESTALTTIPFLTHHGLIFVPFGYKSPKLMDVENLHGGSPWGASAIAAGDGSRAVSDIEKEIGEAHGKHFGEIVSTYAKGKASAAEPAAASTSKAPAPTKATEEHKKEGSHTSSEKKPKKRFSLFGKH